MTLPNLLTEEGRRAATEAYVNGAGSGDASREVREFQVLGLAMRMLSVRVYQWATLLLVAGAWGYTLLEPTRLRIVAAVLFTVLTHLPTWARDMRGNHAQGT